MNSVEMSDANRHFQDSDSFHSFDGTMVSFDKAPAEAKINTLQLNINKAGMEGLNVEKINKIIQNASEGSKFYLHKQKCQKRIDERIAQMKTLSSKLSISEIEDAEKEMDRVCGEMENSRDLSKTIVHVDMDMFYAAVEMRDDPTLRDIPMAVGDNSMLSTSNYIARKYGVRAALPGFIAKKLCPDLVIVPCNFDKYRSVSKKVEKVFEFYDPQYCMMSLDEGYLDITQYLRENACTYCNTDSSHAEEVVQEIRRKIQEETQLTASAGIASNTLLAKVCSDMNKPNGQFYLPPIVEKIKSFMQYLPIRKVSGIGNVSEQQLGALGVQTCSDLFLHRGKLKLLYSETSINYFMRIALALGSTEVSSTSERERKSISNETTFQPTSDRDVLIRLCRNLCQDLSEDMAKRNLYGKVLTLKLKTEDFQTRTRAQSLFEHTRDVHIMSSVTEKFLLSEIGAERSKIAKSLTLRLLGVKMSNFMDKVQGRESKKKQTTLANIFQRISNAKIQNTKPAGNTDNGHDLLTFKQSDYSARNISTVTTASSLEHTSCPFIDGSEENTFFNSPGMNDTITSRGNTDQLTCPVCAKMKFMAYEELNTHLDTCLSTSAVQEAVKEINASVSKTCNSLARSADYFSVFPSKDKKTKNYYKQNGKNEPTQKKRKITNTLSNYFIRDSM